MRKELSDKEALLLVSKVNPKFKPVWENLSQKEQMSLAKYFLSHGSQKEILDPIRPRVINWYCPFACQKVFPSGHRYCINVYSGCHHQCSYCYAASYSVAKAVCKKNFQLHINKDLEDLKRFNVPAAPVHISNSTDPFQPLEEITQHTKYTLEQILEQRNSFTTVTMLTKNPLLPVKLGYLDLMQKLNHIPKDHPKYTKLKGRSGFQIEISLAFWQESACQTYDILSPSIADRCKGIRELHKAGIPLVIRIDPLFPRSPLPIKPQKILQDFDLLEAQSLKDLENQVKFAKEVHAKHIVYSTMKIVQSRKQKLSITMQKWREVYKEISKPGKPAWHSGSWRLPKHIAQEHVIDPFLEICKKYDMQTKFCMQNLIETP